DMRVNGFDRRHPVIVDAEGRVIDGRTRLAAADAAGVTPHVRKISAQTDAEIADYVRRANDQRRGTMTPYQKMVHMILWAAAAGEPEPPLYALRDTAGWNTAQASRALEIYRERGPLHEDLWLGRRTGLPPKEPRPRRPRAAAPKAETPEPAHLIAEAKAKAAEAEFKRREKALIRDAQDALAVRDALAALTAAQLPPIERLELGSGLREACAVAMLSDLHV